MAESGTTKCQVANSQDMTLGQGNSGWISEQQALAVLVLVSIFVALLVLLPYLQFILLAIVLGYVLWPLQVRLERLVSPTVAALGVSAAVILSVLLPAAYLIWLAIQESIQVMQELEQGEIEIAQIEAELAAYGLEVNLLEFYEANSERIMATAEQLGLELFGVFRSLPRLFIGLTITIFVMFALLRDGGRLVAWLQAVAPVEDDVQSEFVDRLDRLMWASIIGNVGASLIQAVALALGLWALGFDNVVLLGIITFVLALLPLVGAFGVWVPLVAYLALLGSVVSALALFVWGSIVSLSDFYTRPLVIGKSAALNSATVVVGVFGGLVAFGMIGLFIGPVVVGGAKISLDLYARERAERTPGMDADDAVSLDEVEVKSPERVLADSEDTDTVSADTMAQIASERPDTTDETATEQAEDGNDVATKQADSEGDVANKHADTTDESEAEKNDTVDEDETEHHDEDERSK